MPSESTIVKRTGDNTGQEEERSTMEAIGDRIRNLRPTMPTLPARFGNIPDLPRTEVKTDFKDDEWFGRAGIRLFEISNEHVCRLGRVVLPKLGSELSESDMGALMLLAFQLRGPGAGNQPRVFPSEIPRGMGSQADRNYTDLDTSTYTSDTQIASEGLDESENAKAYSFLAASTLRLFARSHDNYLQAWSQIRGGYRKFYVKPCPVGNIQPRATVLNSLHSAWNLTENEIFKVTLYRILYLSNTEEASADDLKMFLYDRYLFHTGMHIISIFYRLCVALNCRISTLLKAIYARRFDRQITDLITLLTMFCSSDPTYQRRMWKYARIFDPNFMSSLRTRTCPKLVFLLACMLKRLNPETAKDILSIKQLEDVSDEYRERFKAEAEVLISWIYQAESGQTPTAPSQK
ncbi:uncharacterized protein LOC133866943 [Alnus glutinosa]|uniref:uncharacterized protein LOC133866943 n=1 Tax=Alnus glutinosa TaxID=3517 RepID=UPI002D78B405|nr:uncharacterized protein LOC133866943 [Alnus glutinosa]